MTRNQDERDLLYKPEAHGHQFDVGRLHRTDGFDIDLFFKYLEEGREEANMEDMYAKKHKEYHAWLKRDLVVDTRESWRQWMNRQMLFQDPPMVPREELPEEFHPHRSFYGKLANTMSGVDPTPPEAKRTVAQEMRDLESAVQQ